jgi:hypothetical protein
VVEYIIAIVKTFIVVAKTTRLSSINGCNQNWMTLGCKQNNMNHTRLLLGLLFVEYFLGYSLKVLKKSSKIFIILFILLC